MPKNSLILKIFIFLWIFFCLIALSAVLVSAAKEAHSLPSKKGTIAKSEQTSSPSDFIQIKNRQYTFPDGNIFTQEQSKFTQTQEEALSLKTYRLPGESGSLIYYDSEIKKWVETKLQTGTLPAKTLYLVIENQGQKSYLLLSQALAYLPENEYLLDYLPKNNGYFSLDYQDGIFYLTQMAKPTAGVQIESWSLSSSDQPLIDWSSDLNYIIWQGYLLDDDNRFNYDGYYYRETGYLPEKANSFKLIPCSYVINGLVQTNGSLASDQLGIAMLDIMRKQQNKDGYFPTLPTSLWLKAEYQLSGGFYDTRFCTELAYSYLVAYEKFGIESFYETADKYGQFFLRHAQEHHFSLKKQAGWLVEDYWQPDNSVAFHSSLNHQLREIYFLYRLEQVTHNSDYADLADRMLTAVKTSTPQWILPDQNLAYAFKPNGQIIGTDYPYLTYNDLFNLQNLLLELKGAKDSDLQKLMDAKMQWMKTNQVIGYKTGVNGFTTSPTSQLVVIDGQGQVYTAYNIRGYNYFRLRDLAQALKQSFKPFDLSWEQGAIQITSGQAYSGTEEILPSSLEKTIGYPSKVSLFYNGQPKYLTAYNINGYTYFKLRNLAKMLDINLEWSNNQIILNTSLPYESEF